MKNSLLVILILTIIHIGCKTDSSGQYNYRVPEKLDDGITVGNCNEANIDSRYLSDTVNDIYRGKLW
ncbi:MAG: hypothetical protein HQ541_10830 [Mariniphaga sp.]|nr:hypothetical protein [Mariniphaga sp.]